MNKIFKRVASIIAASAMAVGLLVSVPTSALAVGESYTLPTHNCTHTNEGHIVVLEITGANIKAAVFESGATTTTTTVDFDSSLFTDTPVVGKIYYDTNPDIMIEQYSLCKASQSQANSTSTKTTETTTTSTPHTHNYVYTVITAPTENYDGEAADVCSCGDSKNHVILPAIDTIMAAKVTQIEQAKAGQTITLKMNTVNSLPNWFMSKIASKNDVNFKIQIQYQHKNYEICIPRGTSVDLNEAWYGPAKLMSLYTTTQKN